VRRLRMVNSCVLVRAASGKIMVVLDEIKKVRNVRKAFAVYGRYDIVAFVEAPDFVTVVGASKAINALDGVRSTETAIEA